MGIILDSSVVISAERAGQTPAMLMERVFQHLGDQPAAISSIGYAELAHGIYRSKTELQRSFRRTFVADLVAQLSAYPFTREAADLAAKIGAETMMAGTSSRSPISLSGQPLYRLASPYLPQTNFTFVWFPIWLFYLSTPAPDLSSYP